jgi:hypothetical protein
MLWKKWGPLVAELVVLEDLLLAILTVIIDG